MKDKIRVIVADDIKETRENIKTLLSFNNRIEVVAEAKDGNEIVEKAREYLPDIILMDINMPEKDGIKATEEISIEMPGITIIIMSVQGDSEYLKRAMTAGAREYIIKPFTAEELINAVINTYSIELQRKERLQMPKTDHRMKSKVITVFSTKGGVGKTTIACNLAAAMAQQSEKRVVLLDLDWFFGDVAIHLSIPVKNTISDMIKEMNQLDEDLAEEYLASHFTGVKILPAPARPEYAEYITAAYVEKIIRTLQESYHYVIIDTGQNFNETTLTALDLSEIILFVSTIDLPTIKNVKTGLEVMDSLHYSDNKVKIVLNKATEQFGIKYKDFEDTLKKNIWAYIPEDCATVINAANKGFPFVITRPETKVSRSIYDMALKLIEKKKDTDQTKKLFKKILMTE